MYVEESVGNKTSTVDVEDWEEAYMEVKNILEHRFHFEEVNEKRFRHHKDKGLVVSRIEANHEMDRYTEIEITIVLTIDLLEQGSNRASITVDTKGLVVTRYPEGSSWQRSPLYFALRSIWDKLVYGWARGRWKDEGREMVTEVHAALRGAFNSMAPMEE